VQVQAHHQQEGHHVWDLENWLDIWVGKCPLCYVRKCQGSEVDMWHGLEECVDEEQELVTSKVKALESIDFQRYASCCNCGVA
jgi:hypothetical protein